MYLTSNEKKLILEIARKSIAESFEAKKVFFDEKFIPAKLKQKAATFVTLTKKDELRGCIGKLMPNQELYKDIVENARLAAFSDFRFPALIPEELSEIKIEVSILELPKKLNYKNSEDLVEKLQQNMPGVILEYGLNKATFLPQVWDELPQANVFLSELCLKAGLAKNFWKDNNLKIQIYSVTNFSE